MDEKEGVYVNYPKNRSLLQIDRSSAEFAKIVLS